MWPLRMMHWVPTHCPPHSCHPLPLPLRHGTWVPNPGHPARLHPSWHGTWVPNTPSCLWYLVLITENLFKLVYWRIYPHGADTWWWPLKHIQLASGWYASYWNAVLSVIRTVSHVLNIPDSNVAHYFQMQSNSLSTKRLFTRNVSVITTISV